MPTELIDDDPKIGDLVGTSGENPVIHPPEPPVIDPPSVVANFTLARDSHGACCIRVGGRRIGGGYGTIDLTAAEAHQLAVELTEAADHIGEIRVKQGFDN